MRGDGACPEPRHSVWMAYCATMPLVVGMDMGRVVLVIVLEEHLDQDAVEH